MKKSLALVFVAFLFATTSFGQNSLSQIDTNRSVNGWQVTSRSSNIITAYSEMTDNVGISVKPESKHSQTFVVETNDGWGSAEWTKILSRPIQNLVGEAGVIWVYLEKLGNSLPNYDYLEVDKFYLIDSAGQSSWKTDGTLFIPGWLHEWWYPIPVNTSKFGDSQIKGLRFVFRTYKSTRVAFDEMGWFDGSRVHTTIERFEDLTIVGVEDETAIPTNFTLFQNYPNPFNPETVIRFELKSSTFVKLKVFNTLGQEIVELVNEEKFPGTYEVNFNASNLPSGTYFYRLQTKSFVETKKMALIK